MTSELHAVLENVSRRGFLRGTSALAGLIVAAQFVPVRGALAAGGYKTGAVDMPHGTVSDPHVFVAIDPWAPSPSSPTAPR